MKNHPIPNLNIENERKIIEITMNFLRNIVKTSTENKPRKAASNPTSHRNIKFCVLNCFFNETQKSARQQGAQTLSENSFEINDLRKTAEVFKEICCEFSMTFGKRALQERFYVCFITRKFYVFSHFEKM